MRRHSGYTLTEILIVISIIVLVLGMATLAFNSLTGARSGAAAFNVLSATLGRARAMAIMRDSPVGLVLFIDRASNRSAFALVRTPSYNIWDAGQPGFPTRYDAGAYVTHNGGRYVCRSPHVSGGGTAPPNATYWAPAGPSPIDLLPDQDMALMPVGVRVQAIATDASADKYLSTAPVIFDGKGLLDFRPYTIAKGSPLGQMMGLRGDLFFLNAGGEPTRQPILGYVVFDLSAFSDQPGATEGDAVWNGVVAETCPAAFSPTEQSEEAWIRENAEHRIINRYNGTFMRNE